MCLTDVDDKRVATLTAVGCIDIDPVASGKDARRHIDDYAVIAVAGENSVTAQAAVKRIGAAVAGT